MSIKTHQYSNKDITIIWKPDVCIHSKLCWHGLRDVFDPARRPWIVPDAADTAIIMAQIDKCPSGALSYIKNAATEEIAAKETVPVSNMTTIECLPNGPILVQGELLLKKKSDGSTEIKSGPVALCRCGASKNKPYCDGSHRTNAFEG